MRVVVALGGNALLRRGEPMTVENQRANVRVACEQLAPVAAAHELVISHGNGPQIGLLALQGAAYERGARLPARRARRRDPGDDRLPARAGARQPAARSSEPLATLLTMIEVDPADPAFDDPTKPIGPIYTADGGRRARRRAQGWTFRPDGDAIRRVVPSPRAEAHLRACARSRWLLEQGCVVICAGGGGIPTAYGDRTAAARASRPSSTRTTPAACWPATSSADVFVMATDTPRSYLGFGTPEQRADRAGAPRRAAAPSTATSSPRARCCPRSIAACDFAQRDRHDRRSSAGSPTSRNWSRARAGTTITTDDAGIDWRPPEPNEGGLTWHSASTPRSASCAR